MTQSDSLVTPRYAEGYRNTYPDESNSPNPTDAFEKSNIRLPSPAGLYVFNVDFDDGPHIVTSFFRRPDYRVKMFIGATWNASLTVASLLDIGASLNLIQRYFLPQA